MATSPTRSQDTDSPAPEGSPRVQLARRHGALHEASLSIARWTSGNSPVEMEIAALLMPSDQVNWHAQAQKDFLAWLQLGGFAQAPVRPRLEEDAARAPRVDEDASTKARVEENPSHNTEATALPAAAPLSLRDNLRGIVILS